MVYLVNGSDQSISFAPQSVQIDAIKQRKGNSQRVRLRTYGAEDYEKKVRTAQAWAAAAYGFSVGMANQPQPQASYVSGSYSGYDPYGSAEMRHLPIAWGAQRWNYTINTGPLRADAKQGLIAA